MTTRLFIGNDYFGAGNVGDDLTLAGFVSAAVRYPEIEFRACTAYDRAAVQRRFPQIRWLPEGEAERDEALQNADAWLGLGDTPFQLDSGPWLLDRNERERRRCAAFAKPMYLLGVGCESSEAARDPRSAALLAAAERVWTRDAFTAGALRPFVDASRLCPGADVAHLAFRDQPDPPPPDLGVVGLLLAFERREQFDLNELARFIERRPSERTRWLVQEVRALPHLERWILERLTPAAAGKLAVMDVAYGTVSTAEYLRAFGTPEVTISSRYHGALVAAWHGSKVLIVSRSMKLQGLADELELPRIDRVTSHAAMEAALASAAAAPRERLYRLRDLAAAMCDAFFAGLVARTAGASRRTQQTFTPPRPTEPLAPRSLRAAFEADLPRRLTAGETTVVRCVVANHSDVVYASAPPHPVELCYRWYDANGGIVGAGTWVHTALPRPLGPGGRLDTFARVTAPAAAGDYTLAMTLLQENVAWFDDVDPANGVRGVVTVTPAGFANGDTAFFALPAEERRRLTQRAIETRTPLLARWSSMHGTGSEGWHRRAAIAAEWLSAAEAVADLGCGAMTLEQYLAPGQRYVPVDLTARDERTIVLDLERHAFPPFGADACALLGVLAYLFDPLPVLEKIRRSFARCVVSYNFSGDAHGRLSSGRVNHLDRDGVVRLFRDAGFTVARERVIDGRHYLFEIAAASGARGEDAEVQRAGVAVD
jgi:hypothetical protein